MYHHRNYVISLAGFDPSAGAGILADVKTFEQLGVYGLGVCSALTWQTEDEFQKVTWVSPGEIISQLEVLLRKYKVRFLKIGLIESLDALEKILQFISGNFPGIKMLWDPILKASAGYAFHPVIDKQQLMNCCKELFLVTPNSAEAMQWMGEEDPLAAAEKLSVFTSVFLKSVLKPDGKRGDVLLTRGEKYFLET